MADRIQLGDTVKDAISGFTGAATGRTEWLNGCVRVAIQPPVDKDGKMLEAEWIDEGQLVIVKPLSAAPVAEKPGGPQADPAGPVRDPS